MPNIPRSKGNQTMKFVQLTEYNRNSFLKNHAENKAGIALNLPDNQNKLYKTLDY